MAVAVRRHSRKPPGAAASARRRRGEIAAWCGWRPVWRDECGGADGCRCSMRRNPARRANRPTREMGMAESGLSGRRHSSRREGAAPTCRRSATAIDVVPRLPRRRIVLAITPGRASLMSSRARRRRSRRGLASCFGTASAACSTCSRRRSDFPDRRAVRRGIQLGQVPRRGLPDLPGHSLLLRNHHEFALRRSHRAARAVRLEGITVEALNVKTALFFPGFPAAVVTPGQPLVRSLVLLGSVCVALNTLVDVVAVRRRSPARVRHRSAARARLLTRVRA